MADNVVYNAQLSPSELRRKLYYTAAEVNKMMSISNYHARMPLLIKLARACQTQVFFCILIDRV